MNTTNDEMNLKTIGIRPARRDEIASTRLKLALG